MDPRISLGRLRRAVETLHSPRKFCIMWVQFSSDLKGAIEALPNFVPAAKYVAGEPIEGEIGKVELFRFVEKPSLKDGEWVMELEQSA